MAIATTYNTGTASISANSTAVTGQGTTWLTSGLQAGDLFWAAGLAVRIGSVNSNTSITLAYPWPGATRATDTYEVRFTPDATRVLASARELIDILANGNLAAVAALNTVADRIAYYTGAGAAALATLTSFGRSLIAAGSASAARVVLDALGSDTAGSITATSANVDAGVLTIRDNATTTGDVGNAVFRVNRQNSGTPAVIIGNDGSGRGLLGSNNSDLRVGSWNSGVFTERYRFQLAGKLLFDTAQPAIGTAEGGNGIAIGAGSESGLIRASRSSAGVMILNRDTTTGALVSFRYDLTDVGNITVTGSATAYNTSSDYRLKTDIEPLVDFALTAEQFDKLDDALLRVMLTRPVRYHWRSDPEGPWVHGYIAHELEGPAPHAVTGTRDEVEDIGTATIAAYVAPGGSYDIVGPDGAPTTIREPDEMMPAQVFAGITEREAPEGATWVKTGTRPVYQSVDHSKRVPDLEAAIQALTLMVLAQTETIAGLEARLSAVEAA